MTHTLFHAIPYQWEDEQFVLRTARVEDVAILADLKTQVWPEEKADPKQIAAALDSAEHLTLVAELAGKPVAFADSFWTQGSSGKRWEVDLLAVSSQYRGRRLGEALVRASVQSAGKSFSRALIQTVNIASQTTFSRCGFTCSKLVHRLYVCSEQNAEPAAATHDARLIKVVTMSYSGIWLENSFTQRDLLAARSQIGDDTALTGAVIPSSMPGAFQAAEECGYHFVADYQWWIKER